jgi:hypothetical protein
MFHRAEGSDLNQEHLDMNQRMILSRYIRRKIFFNRDTEKNNDTQTEIVHLETPTGT